MLGNRPVPAAQVDTRKPATGVCAAPVCTAPVTPGQRMLCDQCTDMALDAISTEIGGYARDFAFRHGVPLADARVVIRQDMRDPHSAYLVSVAQRALKRSVRDMTTSYTDRTGKGF